MCKLNTCSYKVNLNNDLCIYIIMCIVMYSNCISTGIPAVCLDLVDPDNGRVNYETQEGSTTTQESLATYICNTGYQLNGTSSRTCQSDGTWSGSAPTCTRMQNVHYAVKNWMPHVDFIHISYYVIAIYIVG